jgi:deoxyribodipyrimidine photo-lyase
MATKGLVWFRADLRLADNPALAAAIKDCETVLALYVLETDTTLRPLGGAVKAWLAESLQLLREDLADCGVALHVLEGESARIIPQFVSEHGVGAVHWNRRYGQAERDHDAAIKDGLKGDKITVESHNGALLVEPWDIATKTGTPYAVFTPYWKALRDKHIEAPLRRPAKTARVKAPAIRIFSVQPAWAKKVLSHWEIGEDAAKRRLQNFLASTLVHYVDGRDVPGKDHTSALSPYLRFGEISPRQIWHATRHAMDREPKLQTAGDKFLSELAWRDFAYHLLYHRQDIARVPMQEKFKDVDWRTDTKALAAWQTGQTGIPIVDAGMRQLWETGWMHNRVRMLVASLLSKNLLIDWRIGEDWFWDTLVDADPGNNPASWQWVAGCGADAAPYFRIFNPVTQGERFDAGGDYVRRWVPELKDVPDKFIHHPWDAPEPPKDYPEPMVDLKTSRERALEALGAV